jgi:arylsulfatase A-like enzyme
MVFSVTQGGNTFLVRTKDWAYIQYQEDGSLGMELFDMRRDPQQFTNLAHLPAYAPIVADFQQKLQEKLKAVRTNDLGKDYGGK